MGIYPDTLTVFHQPRPEDEALNRLRHIERLALKGMHATTARDKERYLDAIWQEVRHQEELIHKQLKTVQPIPITKSSSDVLSK